MLRYYQYSIKLNYKISIIKLVKIFSFTSDDYLVRGMAHINPREPVALFDPGRPIPFSMTSILGSHDISYWFIFILSIAYHGESIFIIETRLRNGIFVTNFILIEVDFNKLNLSFEDVESCKLSAVEEKRMGRETTREEAEEEKSKKVYSIHSKYLNFKGSVGNKNGTLFRCLSLRCQSL